MSISASRYMVFLSRADQPPDVPANLRMSEEAWVSLHQRMSEHTRRLNLAAAGSVMIIRQGTSAGVAGAGGGGGGAATGSRPVTAAGVRSSPGGAVAWTVPTSMAPADVAPGASSSDAKGGVGTSSLHGMSGVIRRNFADLSVPTSPVETKAPLLETKAAPSLLVLTAASSRSSTTLASPSVGGGGGGGRSAMDDDGMRVAPEGATAVASELRALNLPPLFAVGQITELHPHPLTLRSDLNARACVLCTDPIGTPAYHCETCGWNMCKRCGDNCKRCYQQTLQAPARAFRWCVIKFLLPAAFQRNRPTAQLTAASTSQLLTSSRHHLHRGHSAAYRDDRMRSCLAVASITFHAPHEMLVPRPIRTISTPPLLLSVMSHVVAFVVFVQRFRTRK